AACQHGPPREQHHTLSLHAGLPICDRWPAGNFISKRVKAPAGLGDALNFGWELDYYEFLHKWNGGVPLLESLKITDPAGDANVRSEEHTSELQSRENLVCRLLLETK